MTEAILQYPGCSALTFGTLCAVLLWATVAIHEVRLARRREEDDSDFHTHRHAPGYIRANDWEFIPVHAGNCLPRDQIVTPQFYWDMKSAEAAGRTAREDREFWSVLSEMDTAEIEIDRDDEDDDWWERDYGGEGG